MGLAYRNDREDRDHQENTSRNFRLIPNDSFGRPPLTAQPIPPPPEADIQLVMQQTNVSRNEAEDALSRNNNDIVNAIMDIST
jgi:hypothetical protein